MRSAPIAVLSVLLALPLAAQQDSSAPPAPQSQPAPRKNSQKKDNGQKQEKPPASSSGTQANPFPEAQSEKAAQQAQQQDQNGNPAPDAAPDAPPPAPSPSEPQRHSGKSTADQNPFPEAQSEKAAHQAEQQPSPGAKGEAPGNPDSSSSQVKGLDLSGAANGGAPDGAGGTVLSPELGRKDTKVGDFYLKTGDFKGAYDRFAEATKVDPTNADAVFGLAEAARHLNHRTEAISNYQLYLDALPDGPHSKDARKALRDLQAAPHS